MVIANLNDVVVDLEVATGLDEVTGGLEDVAVDLEVVGGLEEELGGLEEVVRNLEEVVPGLVVVVEVTMVSCGDLK